MDKNDIVIDTATDDGQPKKYIRTFAGDAATVQAGGTPALAQAAASDVVPVAETPKDSDTPPPPVSPPPAPKAPPPVVRQAPIVENIVVDTPSTLPTPQPLPETLSPQQLAPPPPASAPSRPPPPPAPPPEHSRPIETYSDDFSQRMKNTNASTASILAAEQDAARVPSKEAPSSRWNIVYVVAGIILIIAGAAGAYVAYTRYLAKSLPVLIAPVVSAPIFVDERAEITGTSSVLSQAIEQSVTSPLAPGAVRFLYTETATSSDNIIFSALLLPAPDILLRNINAAGSMAGVVNAGGTQSPFFILSVASYGDTFSGMLSWEKTMTRDLSALFPPYPAAVAPPVATTTVATTTTTKKTAKTVVVPPPPPPVFIPAFYDEVIDNHDARVYRDSGKRSVIVYGYWNQTTLVIARDPAAFTEILNRLATSRSQQ